MKKLVILISVLLVQFCYAQREANIWHFGDEAGIDFNSCEPEVTFSEMSSSEGCTSIADSSGQLQFYTEGTKIWNRNHVVMTNGSGLLGHRSASQSSMIIKRPGISNEYYVFTIDEIGKTNGLMYSTVDMNADGGLGAVISKNVSLISPVLEKIHATRHANGEDVWVSVHGYENRDFYSFLVTSTGITTVPVTSSVGPIITKNDLDTATIGTMKFSPNGKKLAICNFEHGVDLFDFDNNSGVFSNPVEVSPRLHCYGVEFSKSNNILYVNTAYLDIDNKLLQFDLRTPVIKDSEIVLLDLSDTGGFGSLQLAPDRKVYVSIIGRNSLSVINEPNRPGLDCNFVEDAFDLEGGTAKAGLPLFLFPIFHNEIIVDQTCSANNTYFTLSENVDAVTWDFGDPASGANNISTELEPFHVYNTPGTYTITTNIPANCGPTPFLSREIEIFGQPNSSSIQLTQCDDDSDGFSFFNLNEADIKLSQDYNNEVFLYYRTEEEARNRTNSISPSNAYQNVIAFSDSVWASVEVNSGCFGVVEVELIVSGSNVFETFEPIVFSKCDDDLNDGITVFDFSSVQSIIEELYPSQEIEISYYRNLEDALAETDSISDISSYENIGYPYYQEIYVRVDDNVDNDCLVIGKPIGLIVQKQPQFELATEAELCLNESSSLTLEAYNPDDIYTYEWTDSNGNVISTSINATVSDSDIYTVIATGSNGCKSNPKQIVVTVFEKIEITLDMITIRDGFNNNTITIDEARLGTEDYEYALDNEFGIYQEDPFFENVSAGFHTIYVRGKNNCKPSSIEISIIGFPKFFTPNNDTFNDTWNIVGLSDNFQISSKIHIYDRYGKLLKQINPHGEGWDGTYNGENSVKSDYWFKAELIDQEGNIRILQGHFSLIR